MRKITEEIKKKGGKEKQGKEMGMKVIDEWGEGGVDGWGTLCFDHLHDCHAEMRNLVSTVIFHRLCAISQSSPWGVLYCFHSGSRAQHQHLFSSLLLYLFTWTRICLYFLSLSLFYLISSRWHGSLGLCHCCVSLTLKRWYCIGIIRTCVSTFAPLPNVSVWVYECV